MALPRTIGALLIPFLAIACHFVLHAQATDGNIRILYQSDWTSPYLHYKANDKGWTPEPGMKMQPSSVSDHPATEGWFQYDVKGASKLEFAFNDGKGHWDNNLDKNFHVSTPATYTIAGSGFVQVLFQTEWTTPFIHYNANGWTSTPGKRMVPSTTPGYASASNWFQYNLKASSGLEFAFNNGKTPIMWDNNDNQNYKVSVWGIYAYNQKGGCTNWDGLDGCNGGHSDYSTDMDQRKWQTPSRNSSLHKPEYQDMRSLTGYAHVEYAADRNSATVTARTFQRVSGAKCSYSFNGHITSSNSFQVDSSLSNDLIIEVTCNQWTLKLEPVNFLWQNNVVHQPESMEGGQRGAVVDLFGWPYRDIEQECQDFLGKAGYMGVKINPPQESVMADDSNFGGADGERNPWFLVYQPVSYKLHSRLGSRAELRSMLQTCRANGVRVYADAVVNHMVGNSNDVSPTHRVDIGGGQCMYWGPRTSTARSPFFTGGHHFQLSPETQQRPALEFPSVPYGPTDFHCERGIDSWSDPFQLSTGWLAGLADLNTGKDYVQQRIAQYFVDLLGIGFSGVRVDAAKHISPQDLSSIYGYFNKYMGGSLPADFVSWHELLLGGQSENDVLACHNDANYNYYDGLDRKLREKGLSDQDIQKIKVWSSDYPLQHPICGQWVLPPSRFVIQNDDHDQQFGDTRPMGNRGSILVREKNVEKHRGFEVDLFNARANEDQSKDWKIRVVLSSYTITQASNGALIGGFPDGQSDCSGFHGSVGSCTVNIPYEKAFRQGSCGYTVENWVVGKYTRVHRDLRIVDAMRSWMKLPGVSASQLGMNGCN